VIRVAVINDSPIMRDLLKTILEADPEVSVVSAVANAAEFRESLSKAEADVAVATEPPPPFLDLADDVEHGWLRRCKWIKLNCPWEAQDGQSEDRVPENAVFLAVDLENPVGKGEEAFQTFGARLRALVKAAARKAPDSRSCVRKNG